METTFNLANIGLINTLIAQINENQPYAEVRCDIYHEYDNVKLFIWPHSIDNTASLPNNQFVSIFFNCLEKFISIFNLDGIDYESCYSEMEGENKFCYLERIFKIRNLNIKIGAELEKNHVQIFFSKY
jgi:hypothetical protein